MRVCRRTKAELMKDVQAVENHVGAAKYKRAVEEWAGKKAKWEKRTQRAKDKELNRLATLGKELPGSGSDEEARDADGKAGGGDDAAEASSDDEPFMFAELEARVLAASSSEDEDFEDEDDEGVGKGNGGKGKGKGRGRGRDKDPGPKRSSKASSDSETKPAVSDSTVGAKRKRDQKETGKAKKQGKAKNQGRIAVESS